MAAAADVSKSQSAVEHVYAQVLLNVNIIAVFIRFSNASRGETTVKLCKGGSALEITHNGDHIHFQLPARAQDAGQNSSQVFPSPSGPRELGVRLPADNASIPGRQDDAGGLSDPWAAPSLQAMECAHCRECNRNVINPGAVRAWKDLPSENWAEMMDFWHCHKPDEHHGDSNGHDHVAAEKGYSASSHLDVVSGAGYVDLSHLLVSVDDCSAACVFNADVHLSIVSCAGCDSVIGEVDTQNNAFRLFKWALSLGFSNDVQLRRLEKEKCLTLWLFTLDYYLTSWDPPTADTYHSDFAVHCPPTRAVSVFFKSPKTPSPPSTKAADEIETLSLPLSTFTDLAQYVRTNHGTVPESAATYEDWNVSFLRRFSPADVR